MLNRFTVFSEGVEAQPLADRKALYIVQHKLSRATTPSLERMFKTSEEALDEELQTSSQSQSPVNFSQNLSFGPLIFKRSKPAEESWRLFAGIGRKEMPPIIVNDWKAAFT
jgi:hypothetical protein